MLVLSGQETEQLTEALRLSAIYMQEHPFDDSPIRKVRESLDFVVNGGKVDNRCQELENLLREVLGGVSDGSGAVLRPSPALVEKVKRALGGN